MTKRTPYSNEVDWVETTDGKKVFSIRKRNDGNYEFFVESLNYDHEEETHFWTECMLPRSHIFGSISEAKNEILAQFANQIDAK